MNVAFVALKVTGAPSTLPASRKVTVPVGVPEVNDVTVAVNVTDCPSVEGFGEEVTTRFVPAPVDGVAVPTSGIEKGLPGALVETKIFPFVGAFPPVKTSVVGAKETLIVQLSPPPRLAGQLFVSEKFSRNVTVAGNG